MRSILSAALSKIRPQHQYRKNKEKLFFFFYIYIYIYLFMCVLKRYKAGKKVSAIYLYLNQSV